MFQWEWRVPLMQAVHLGYHYLDWWASFQRWNRLNSCTIDSCEEWHLCWTFCVSMSSRSWVRKLSESAKSQWMSKCTAELTDCLSVLSCLRRNHSSWLQLAEVVTSSSFHHFSIRSTYKATGCLDSCVTNCKLFFRTGKISPEEGAFVKNRPLVPHSYSLAELCTVWAVGQLF